MASQSMRYPYTRHSPTCRQQIRLSLALHQRQSFLCGRAVTAKCEQSILQPSQTVHFTAKFDWMHDQHGVEGAARTSRLGLQSTNSFFVTGRVAIPVLVLTDTVPQQRIYQPDVRW